MNFLLGPKSLRSCQKQSLKKKIISLLVSLLFTLILLFNHSFPIEIEYFGHSAFKIKTKSSTIIIDPYEYELKYPFLKSVDKDIQNKKVDLVLSTHNHFDHFNQEIFNLCNKIGIPYFVGAKDMQWIKIYYKFKDVTVYSIKTFHDQNNGKDRGLNSVIFIIADNYKIAHLGDLGHLLDDNQQKELKNIDLMFIPVGGYFTISSEQATKIIGLTNPKTVIPMHYKTKYTQDFPIDNLDKFISVSKSNLKKYKLKEINGRIVNINSQFSDTILYFNF